MLSKAFRPWHQLPDQPLRPWPSAFLAGFEVGAKQVSFVRVVWTIPLGASCAQRPASAFGALELGAINVLTFSLWCEIAQLLLNKCHDASAFPFGEGGTDCEAGGDG